MPKRTYVDSCVLMAAFQGKGIAAYRAMEILDDPNRKLVVSDAVRLELLPKASYYQNQKECMFYEAVFEAAEFVTWDVSALREAYNLAIKHGLSALDAIHVATALAAGVDEFVTKEKPSKPMFRVPELTMFSIS
jgi:predicted nucleic acid-binding protein